MSKQQDHNKTDIVNLYLASADHDSRDKEASLTFLASNGVNTSKLMSEGLKRIRRIQLLAEARKTELEMNASESVRSRAIAWVDQLLGSVDFSLTDLVQKEELTVSFRSMESLSKEDLRNILIRHFTLKFMNQQNKGG